MSRISTGEGTQTAHKGGHTNSTEGPPATLWSIAHTLAYFVNIFRAGRVLHSMASHTWPFVNMAESTQAHIGHQQHEEEKVFLVTIKMIMIELMVMRRRDLTSARLFCSTPATTTGASPLTEKP